MQESASQLPAAPLESSAPARPITPLTITCPSQVVAAVPFECRLAVNPEPLPAGDGVRVSVPPGLFHLANSANVRFDADSRQLALPLDRASGGRFTFSLSLMADEAGAGRTRAISVEAVAADEGVEKSREAARFAASATVVVEPGEPVIVGAFDAPRTPLSATVLLVAAIVAALWTMRQRRRTRLAAMRSGEGSYAWSAPRSSKEVIGLSAIGAIVSVLLVFVCMPACIETVRSRTSFVATTCTIVDRGSSGFAPELTYVPTAIVRYEAGGRTRVASGFDVRGTMYGSSDEDPWREFAAGERYPCWYDPAQPARVILRQGPSAVAWFTLLPIAVLMASLGALLGAWRD